MKIGSYIALVAEYLMSAKAARAIDTETALLVARAYRRRSERPETLPAKLRELPLVA